MKHPALSFSLVLLLLLAAGAANAQDLAFSTGGWSFFPDAAGELPAGGPGMFASFGATYGISPHIETGLSVVPRLTPEPLNDIFIEGHIGFSLFGERVRKSGEPAAYINALFDVGLLFGAQDILSDTPEYSRTIFLRLTPIALGNPYYGRRDRLISLGLLYDYDRGSSSLFLNLIAADFFLASPRKVH